MSDLSSHIAPEKVEVVLPLYARYFEERISHVFGKPLEDAVRLSTWDVPAPVHILLEYLWEREAYREEGLFRISGSQVLSESLISELNIGEEILIDLEQKAADCHTVAGVLKRYIRELPEPLLPEHTFPVEISKESAHEMISNLGDNERNLCVRLFGFLRQVVQHENENLMGTENLARVWSISLMGDSGNVSEVLDRVRKLSLLFSSLWR
jgi:RalA-binding protein 1